MIRPEPVSCPAITVVLTDDVNARLEHFRTSPDMKRSDGTASSVDYTINLLLDAQLPHLPKKKLEAGAAANGTSTDQKPKGQQAQSQQAHAAGK